MAPADLHPETSVIPARRTVASVSQPTPATMWCLSATEPGQDPINIGRLKMITPEAGAPLVRGDDGLGNGQTQPTAMLTAPPCTGAVGAKQRLKQLGQVLR